MGEESGSTQLDRMLQDAQAVVFFYDPMAESYCRVYQGALDPRKKHILPNGFEGSIEESNFLKNFTYSTAHSGKGIVERTKLTVCYVGTQCIRSNRRP